MSTIFDWFYTPYTKAFTLAEHIRASLWERRLGDLWVAVTRLKAPLEASGTYQSGTVSLTWETGQWLRLVTRPAAPLLVKALGQVLRLPATLQYTTEHGDTVVEWWADPAAAAKRWQEIQGKPAFASPQRLDKK